MCAVYDVYVPRVLFENLVLGCMQVENMQLYRFYWVFNPTENLTTSVPARPTKFCPTLLLKIPLLLLPLSHITTTNIISTPPPAAAAAAAAPPRALDDEESNFLQGVEAQRVEARQRKDDWEAEELRGFALARANQTGACTHARVRVHVHFLCACAFRLCLLWGGVAAFSNLLKPPRTLHTANGRHEQ